MVRQRTSCCGVQRFRMTSSRYPVKIQLPALALRNSYRQDRPKGFFFRFKTEICDSEVIDSKHGHTKDTFEETLEKIRDNASKKFAAWYQISYIYQSLCKSVGGTIRTCAVRLHELNNNLKYFPGLYLNTHLFD